MSYSRSIHMNFIILFFKLRTYTMSWILLLWVDDFRMIWDKSHDLRFSMRIFIIEYIYIYTDIWSWESRMSSMIFSWSFWYMIILQLPNYDLIFNIVNFMFYHELVFQVLSRHVSSFNLPYVKLDYWVYWFIRLNCYNESWYFLKVIDVAMTKWIDTSWCWERLFDFESS